MESTDLYIMLFVIFIIFSFVYIFCLKGEKEEKKEKKEEKEEKEKFVLQIFESCGIENNKNMKNSLMNLKSIISSANEEKSSKIPECFYSEALHYLFFVITNKVIECAEKLLYYEKITLRELFPDKSDIAERMIIVSKNKKIWNILNSCYLPKLFFALISYSNYKRGLVKEELLPYLNKIGKSILNNEFNWHKEKGNSEIVKNLLENKVTCNNFDEQFLKYFHEIIIEEFMKFIYLECKRLDIDTNFNIQNNDTIAKVMFKFSKNKEFWDLICKYNYPAVIAFRIYIRLVILQTSVKFNETENKEMFFLFSIFRVNHPLKYYNNIKIWKILNESPLNSFL